MDGIELIASHRDVLLLTWLWLGESYGCGHEICQASTASSQKPAELFSLFVASWLTLQPPSWPEIPMSLGGQHSPLAVALVQAS